MITNEPRRGWLRNAGLLIGGVAALSTSPRLLAQGKGRAAAKKGGEDEKISLGEDLMREHGVLKRVLLIYREVMNRIDSKRDFLPDRSDHPTGQPVSTQGCQPAREPSEHAVPVRPHV